MSTQDEKTRLEAKLTRLTERQSMRATRIAELKTVLMQNYNVPSFVLYELYEETFGAGMDLADQTHAEHELRFLEVSDAKRKNRFRFWKK